MKTETSELTNEDRLQIQLSELQVEKQELKELLSRVLGSFALERCEKYSLIADIKECLDSLND